MRVRRVAVIVALLATVATLVVATRHHAGLARVDRPPATATTIAVPTTPVTTPTEAVSGIPPVPSGFRHDPAGATAAAVAYAQYAAVIVGLPVDQAARAQADVAADQARDTLVARTRQQLTALYAAGPPETLSYRVGVVAVHLVMSSPDDAHAEIWQVGTLCAPNLPAYAQWSTLTEDLVWEHDDWRVAAEQTASGPTPTPDPRTAPTPSTDLAAQLASFNPPGGRP
jgi:hypothetical protein